MLSSKEGFSSEAFEIDSISDITGVSMNKMDYIEQGSRHSGSFSSDNTDALLSISLRHFEGNESLLESASEAGEYTELYKSPGKDKMSSHVGKQQVSFADTFKTGVEPEGFSVNTGTPEVMPLHNGPIHETFSTSQYKDTIHFYGAQDSTLIPHSHSFEKIKNTKDFHQGLNQKDKIVGNLKNEARYMPRKFSSDSEITISSRDSVIKIHSSLPSVNSESLTNKFGQEYSQNVNGEIRQGQIEQDAFKSSLFIQEEPHWTENSVMLQPYSERISKTDGTHQIKTRSKSGPHSLGHSGLINDNTHDIRDINGDHGVIIGDPYIYDGQNMSRHGTIRDINGESKQEYDGHGHSSTGSSQKLRDENVLGFISGTNRNPHSRDGSFLHEARNQQEILRSKDHLQDSFVEHSHGEEMLLGVKHDPETNELYDDKVREGADLLSRVLGGEHNVSFTSYSSRSSERNEKLKSISFREKGSLSKQRSLDSSTHSSEPKLPRSSSPKKDQALNTRTVSNEGVTILSKKMEGKAFGELPGDQTINHKQLELDIEEILSRKKIAMHELQTLEESLQRNKADMKSSESLVEEYRLQATQARSELMDLEKKRYRLQEECTTLDGVIKKSKQKETFNSDALMFGRSKDDIFRALQEREQFKQDLDSTRESLKREQKNSKMAQDDLREKIKSLESEFRKQHEETVKNLQMMKEERKSHIEIVEEKMRREINHWKTATENAELRIKQLEESLFERNDDLDKVRKQLREEKRKNVDIEKQWRSQLESERQDADIKCDEQERSWKDREEKLLQKQEELENLVEERTTDFRRSEERRRSQTEELQKIIESKNEEIKMVRGLVRQQEDATRVLGERLRNEAREHVRNAVEKERQSLHKEKERIKQTIDEEKEKQGRIVKQVTEQLEMEKERHSQTKETLKELKQLTVQADKLQKVDQETARAIYEECRKIAEIVDMPLSYKTPSRFPDEQSGGNDDEAGESPTKQALASLRQCNDELRQRLSEMKKKMAKQSTQKDHANDSKPSGVSDNQLVELRKRLAEKEQEIQRLQRKHNEEIQKLKEEKKKEQLFSRKTIAKLEQEFQKLVATKTSSSSTPYRTKRDPIPSSTISTSNGITHPQSPAVNPASRSVEKSSSADLLKHLQDRVKKLRAENENLKKSSDRESLVKNSRAVKDFNSESALLQSKGLTISQLRTPTKAPDQMNENIEQVSRIQKLLANSKKNDTAVGQSNTD